MLVVINNIRFDVIRESCTMSKFIRFLILLMLSATVATAWGHGFDFVLNTDSNGNPASITAVSENNSLDSDGFNTGNLNSLFLSNFSGTPTTTLGTTFYSVTHGFAEATVPWPGPSQFTATFNVISPLYFSDGNTGAAVAKSGTYLQMFDSDFGAPPRFPGASPGYVNVNGSTSSYSGFQVSLDDAHELEKNLVLAPGSTQTFGEYGFAYDVTVTFNNGTTITTGPLVDVFAMSAASLGDFAANASDDQQDAATTAIYNSTISAGTAVLGTTSSWSGAANNSWANMANWESSAAPGATSGTNSNDTVVFYSNPTNSGPAIDAGRNVQTILFESANVGSLTLGTANGNSLLLTAGGSIQVTSTVVNPQTINAPLVLEGTNALYTFDSDSTSATATLSFGGKITGGAAGNTVLTLGGDNTGANTISGAIGNGAATSLALIESGPCNWILSGPNTYTGATTVNQGTLTVTSTGTLGSSTSPLTISTAANGISAVVNINGSQSVGTLSGTILGGGTTGTLNIAAGSTLRVNQATSADFGATLRIAAGTPTNFGMFAFQGPNTLEIDSAPMLGNQSAIDVNGGTLRFNLSSGTANIGSGVTITVASAATLQLAGSVAALSGGGVAYIVNNGSAASGGGLSVSGTNQVVGSVTGTASTSGVTTYSGDTIVGNGTSPASLTAAQILQNSLTINAGSTVTIGPSSSTTSNVALSVGASSIVGLPVTDAATTDPNPDLLGAIQTAIASGAISSQAGRTLENHIAAIERLSAIDPDFDVTTLENDVLSAFDADFSESSHRSNALAAPAGSIGSPAAVPEPSVFLLAAICALVMIFVARIR
jgi:autotransporter-associated beta strand protein